MGGSIMEEKRLLYIEVHQLKKQGFRISQIANRTRLSRTTVYKYLDLDLEDAIEEFDCDKQEEEARTNTRIGSQLVKGIPYFERCTNI